MATANHQYIPPHERGGVTPDKSESLYNLGIFEPRPNNDDKNVTVRRSSLAKSNHSLNTIESVKTPSATQVNNDLNTDQAPINPLLLAILKSIEDKLDDQGGTLRKVSVSQSVLQKSIEFAHANSSDLKDRIVQLEKQNHQLMKNNEVLQSQGRDMNRRLDNIEQQLSQADHNNRRRNIILEGVGISEGENPMDIVLDILVHVEPNNSRSDIDLAQRVYRPGGKTKPILVVFKSVTQRDLIMGKKKALKDKPNMANIWLNEDSNPVIRKQKLESRSVVRLAVSKGYEAKQRGLGVIVNGRYYSRDNLDHLPEEIKLTEIKTREEGNTIGFQGRLAPLSNMYLCPIVVDGKDHKSAEHLIQYNRVMLANLKEIYCQ